MSEAKRQPLAMRLARGEEAAFAELYDVCADRLHRYISARLACRETAADVVQSTFLRAVKSRKRFRDVADPVAYLFQIARNESMRLGKRPGSREEALAADERFMPDRDAFGQHDDAEMVAHALGRLSAEEREVVELKIFARLTFHEIAEVTGVPQGTAATRFRRALESMRPWFAKQLR